MQSEMLSAVNSAEHVDKTLLKLTVTWKCNINSGNISKDTKTFETTSLANPTLQNYRQPCRKLHAGYGQYEVLTFLM